MATKFKTGTVVKYEDNYYLTVESEYGESDTYETIVPILTNVAGELSSIDTTANFKVVPKSELTEAHGYNSQYCEFYETTKMFDRVLYNDISGGLLIGEVIPIYVYGDYTYCIPVGVNTGRYCLSSSIEDHFKGIKNLEKFRNWDLKYKPLYRNGVYYSSFVLRHINIVKNELAVCLTEEGEKKIGFVCPESGEILSEMGNCVVLGNNKLIASKSHIENGNYKKCEDCGEWYPIDEEFEDINGSMVCRDCIDDHWTRCEDCGEWINTNEDDSVYIERHGYYLCRSCADETCSACEYCGEWERADDMTDTSDGMVCQSCLESHYAYCDHCETYHRNGDVSPVNTENGVETWCDDCCSDDAVWCDNCNEYYNGNDYDNCPNCGNKCIYGYHRHTQPRVFYEKLDGEPEKKANPNVIYFGKEFEMQSGRRNDFAIEMDEDSRIYMERDGSLDDSTGVEVITQPMTFDYLMNSDIIDSVTDTAIKHGMKSHDTNGICGGHIHVSASPFRNVKDYPWKFLLAIQGDNFKHNWKKLSRRSDFHYCKFASEGYTTIQQVKDNSCYIPHDHYGALNLDNIDYRTETVEFRLFRGTLNKNTIRAEFWTVNSVCNFILNGGDVENCTFEELVNLNNAPQYVIDWMKGRGLCLNYPTGSIEEEI